MKLRQDRITFYSHEREGERVFGNLARRLRWSREDARQIGRFIELHMWPFHLSNARVKTDITPRACLRLARAIGNDLPGLFLVAMADSLAGQGP
jgi:poly(A) polymerase